ncbi:unnamed protein product [Ranitomeya imitator]|uniref:C2H2-type domain-containing protein n=1 Tax=Ranitomeya imitator TaxID=111125 RepID=A0ABN9M3C9_9NEOB|nr:unnamed protein product [Ranitomeya imitator]
MEVGELSPVGILGSGHIWTEQDVKTLQGPLPVSASRTVTAGRKVKAEHSGCAFTFTLRPAVTECGKQTARDLTDTRIMVTRVNIGLLSAALRLVTRCFYPGYRHRWSLESSLCDSSPATKQRRCSDSDRCRYRCSVAKMSDSEEDLSVEEGRMDAREKSPQKTTNHSCKEICCKAKNCRCPQTKKASLQHIQSHLHWEVPARKNAKASSAAEEARGTPQENEINMSKLSSKQETISIDRPIKKEILSPKKPKKKMAILRSCFR